ncbi:MAG: PAS domain S-box protein [Cyanobacteriota bacterium]
MENPVQPKKVTRKPAQSEIREIGAYQQPEATSEQISRAPTPFMQPCSAQILAEVEERSLNEFELDSFFTFSLDLLCIAGLDGYFKRVNPAFEKTLGFKAEELLAMPFLDLVHPDDQAATLAEMQKLALGIPTIQFENRFRCKNGSYRWLAWTSRPLTSKGQLYAIGRDVTESKQMAATLQAAHQRLMFHVENSPLGVIEWDSEFRVLYWSKQAEKIFGWKAQEVIGKRLWDWRFIYEEDVELINQLTRQLIEGTQSCNVTQNRNYTKNGSVVYCEWYNSVLFDELGNLVSLRSQVQDVTEQKQAEAALRKNAQMLNLLLEHTPAAIAMVDKDMKYQLVSRRWLEDYNLSEQDIIEKSHYEIFPEIPAHWKNIHQRCVQGAVERCDEDLFVRANGEKQWLKWEIRPWASDAGGINGIIMVSEEITERRKAQEKLQQLNEELIQSNRDLEQFAYVASHDLQEPLRTVTSYAQLLARKYQGNLDAKADKYINYIVEGAARMQQLIEDLLEFSRVGTRAKQLVPTDCENLLNQVLENLKIAIAESRTRVTHDPLPTVMGDETQLIQLFQNLIGNAIKFRGEEVPRVYISVEQREKEWLFSIRDNGIGIETEYFDRIFTIFQRLHSKSEYPGTGIGLAVCKKIVERHGGHIWVESEPSAGTTFHFTIRVSR